MAVAVPKRIASGIINALKGGVVPLCAYARLTGKLHAEICEVAAFGDRTVFVGRKSSHACSCCKCVL